MYSTGEAAKLLRITRDSLLFAIRNAGAPEASQRFSGRRFFSEGDMKKLKKWFKAREQRRPIAVRNAIGRKRIGRKRND